MTGTKEENGIVYFDEPRTVHFLKFAFEHMGCDSIALRDSVDDPTKIKIVAYAANKSANPLLQLVLKTKYGLENYVTMRHMSEMEAYSID